MWFSRVIRAASVRRLIFCAFVVEMIMICAQYGGDQVLCVQYGDRDLCVFSVEMTSFVCTVRR